jgi:S-formylglutathione hydrolase FrmB
MRPFLLILLLSITINFSGLAAKVDTLVINSKVMDRPIKNVVITPDTYNKKVEPYAVLYLLHGAGDNYSSWVREFPFVIAYADKYNIILVCPDGGRTSWYFDSPIDEQMQYETYVSGELVTYIDKNFNTKADKSGRAITGLSMGGHGAFYLAFKHPDIWGAAGSMSGGLDIRPFPNNWDIAKRLGTYRDNKEAWEDNTVINMIYLLDGKNLQLIFDCGIDDFFYDANKRVHEKLLERRIPHDYIERPRGHTKQYWDNSLKYQLLFFKEFFKAEKAAGKTN